jgi:hypothetical protein
MNEMRSSAGIEQPLAEVRHAQAVDLAVEQLAPPAAG